MSAKTRNVSEKHALPPNPIFRSVARSDGNPNTWPTNTVEKLDSEGHVNWMKPVKLEDPPSIKWRKELGIALHKYFEWPEGNYVLEDWPEGYAMFDHHKGKRDAPRHDIYLYGASSKFRSVPEFIPHLISLADPKMPPCKCKYCSKRSQREITETMNKSGLYSHPRQPGPRMRLPTAPANVKRQKLRDAGIHASVQKTPKLKPSRQYVQQSMVPERCNDLRAIQNATPNKLKRWYRQQEVVWVVLSKPIVGNIDEGQCIKCWVGLVEEIKIEKQVIQNHDTQEASSAGLTPTFGQTQGESSIHSQREPSWTVTERNAYRIRFLGVSQCYTVSEEQVLPYQAYILPMHLLKAMHSIPRDQIIVAEANSTFDPQSPTATWEQAVSPFIFSTEQASKIPSFWNFTDEWEIKYMLGGHEAYGSATAPVRSTQSVSEAMNAASSHNAAMVAAANSISSASPSYAYVGASGAQRGMPQEEIDRLGERALGPPPLPAQVLTQTQFQGIWWGAERIWVDELIRLKSPRRCYAPHGTDDILPPSGPGPRTISVCQRDGKDPVHFGAGTRGLFLLMERLFLVDIEAPDGKKKKEARVAGMLYELADDDWVETVPPEGPPPAYSTVSDSGPLRPTSSDALSQPLPLSKRLPLAPLGYRFRPILKAGREAVFSLSIISGRYYPRILQHPFIKDAVMEAVANGLMDTRNANLLWALEGLSAGIHNFTDPSTYRKSRKEMITDADNIARADLRKHFAPSVEEHQQDELAMDVDGDNNNDVVMGS